MSENQNDQWSWGDTPTPPGGDQPNFTPPSGPTPPPEEPRYGQYDPELAQANYGNGPSYAPNFSTSPKQNIQPGIVPLRPLNLSDIINGTFNALRTAPGVFFGFSVAVWTMIAVLSSLASYSAIPDLSAFNPSNLEQTKDNSEFLSLSQHPSFTPFSIVALIFTNLATVFAAGVCLAVFAAAIAELILGRKLTASQCLALSRPHIPKVLGVSLLLGIIEALVAVVVFLSLAAIFLEFAKSQEDMIGIALIWVFGILAIAIGLGYVAIRLAFTIPVLVIEGVGIFQAIARSWQLTRQQFFRTLGIILVGYLIQAAILGILSTVVSLLAALIGSLSNSMALVLVFSTAVTVLLQGILLPISSNVIALLYFDTRMRKEGLGLSLLRASQGENS